jgi:hypothetical protein
MMIHDGDGAQNLLERMAGLTAASERRWGRMTADQMVWHVNAQLEAALGLRECARIDNLFKRTVVKAVALYGPWPKGKAPTAREMLAAGAYDVSTERERFGQLVRTFRERDLSGKWPAHPAFGPLTGRQWSLLGWRHADHHLKQFSL